MGNWLLTLVLILLGWGGGIAAAHMGEAAMARRAVTGPRCPYCQTPAPPGQWSLVIAWLSGHRHCGACGQPLRWERVAAEVLVAATWGLLGWRYGLQPASLLGILAALPLAMVLVTDLEAKLIPNRVMFPAIGAMLVLGVLFGPAMPAAPGWRLSTAPVGGLIGGLTFAFFVWFGTMLFGEGALGVGDIKLATFVGLVVGYPWIITALVLTLLLGGLGGVIVLVVKRGSLRTAIPYGPFLVLGCVLTMIWGVEITHRFLY